MNEETTTTTESSTEVQNNETSGTESTTPDTTQDTTGDITAELLQNIDLRLANIEAVQIDTLHNLITLGYIGLFILVGCFGFYALMKGALKW